MVLVFKTSVKSKKAVKQISPELNRYVSQHHWNFDLQDCDNILRVEGKEEFVPIIIHALRARGFECEELQ